MTNYKMLILRMATLLGVTFQENEKVSLTKIVDRISDMDRHTLSPIQKSFIELIGEDYNACFDEGDSASPYLEFFFDMARMFGNDLFRLTEESSDATSN